MSGLFSRDGAATYLATSPRRVDELRRAGRLLAVLDGREWKFTAADLDMYIAGLKTSAEVSR
jgi:hypothetical protein